MFPRQEYEKVIDALLSGNQDSHSVGITTALQRAGGFEKTFLAQQICFDDQIRESFPDGILWTTMGEEITPEGRLSRVRDLIRWWTDKEAPAFEIVTTAGAKLRELLASSRVLVVVDDVWNPADVPHFRDLKMGCGIWRPARPSEPSKGHSGEVKAVVVVDGRRAVSGSEDQTLRLWDLETCETLALVTLDAPVEAVAVSPNGRIVVVGDQAGKMHCLDWVEPE